MTLPPRGWTRAARLHSARVLGTLITEWDDGAAQLRRVLQDEVRAGGATFWCVCVCVPIDQ